MTKKQSGCNCAQAVLCTYADIVGIDEETAMRLAAPFGAGMGNMEGTCGAIVGAGLVLARRLQGHLHPERKETH